MERGRSKGPQQRTVAALADALVLEGDARKQFAELARDGRLRDHWTRPAGACELPRLVDDFAGRAAELAWMSELAYAGSPQGGAVVGLITSSGGMGKTTLAVRGAYELQPSFPGGVLFLDLLGMSPQPMAADEALRLLLRALGAADEQVPGDVQGRASLYRSLLRDRRALIVLDNAGSEEQVRPLLPGDSPSRVVITAKRLLAGLEGVRRLVLGPLDLPEARELLTGILGERAAADDEAALARLTELCEGLPLALRIIGNRLVSRPGWAAAELAARLADEQRRLDEFTADRGESVGSLIADPPPGAPVPPIRPADDGFLVLDRDEFAASFAADVPGKLAAFMADSQLACSPDALNGAVSEPAWRAKPSWYLVSADDRMIPPAAQRAMAERAKAVASETPASHAVYVSQPAVVAAVISQAAEKH